MGFEKESGLDPIRLQFERTLKVALLNLLLLIIHLPVLTFTES